MKAIIVITYKIVLQVLYKIKNQNLKKIEIQFSNFKMINKLNYKNYQIILYNLRSNKI